MTTMDKTEAQYLVMQYNMEAKKEHPEDNPGSYYSRKEYVATRISEALRVFVLEPDAAKYLKSELESARYVGD